MDWNRFNIEVQESLTGVCDDDSYRISFDVPAANLTTAAVGGKVSCLIEVYTEHALQNILSYCLSSRILPRCIGNGSNVIIPDTGIYDYPLLKQGQKLSFQQVRETETDSDFSVMSGSPLIGLSRELSRRGYSGLEFAAGIPATIGGAVKMNAGAHGESISEVLIEVTIISLDQTSHVSTFQKLGVDDLDFSYRHSNLSSTDFITSACIRLRKSEAETIMKKRTSALNHRKLTQPLHMPSSGSVFKNPSVETPAGFLIESCGMKGFTLGGVMVSDMHANWIVKIDDIAKASDVRALVDMVKNKVYKVHKIELQEEIIFW